MSLMNQRNGQGPRPALQIWLGVVLAITCVGWQDAGGTTSTDSTPSAPPVAPHDGSGEGAASVPLAIQADPGTQGVFDLWSADEATGAGSLEVSSVQFLVPKLVGHRAVDRLRLDRPGLEGLTTESPLIRLPTGRGSLYYVRRPGATGYLHVRSNGLVRMLIERPDVDGLPALHDSIGVSYRGDAALVATTPAAGGDVFVLDLVGLAEESILLTGDLPPLNVDPISLRASRKAAWFVADGVLYRTGTPNSGKMTAHVSGAPGQVWPELVQSFEGDRVVAFYEESDIERRVVVVDADGLEAIATSTAANFTHPDYDDVRGPYVALSDDGTVVAFTHDESPWHGKWSNEIYVRNLNLQMPTFHVTQEPDFPVYLDNVGILGFTHGRVLTFFGGDEFVSGIPSDVGVGAADWFAADFNKPQPVISNMSRTSNEQFPPFNTSPRLSFTEAVMDPRGQRILMSGQPTPDEPNKIVSFALAGGYDSSAFDIFDVAGLDELNMFRGGADLFFVSETNDIGSLPSSPDRTAGDTRLEVLRPLEQGLATLLPIADLGDDDLERVTGYGSVAGGALDLKGIGVVPVFLFPLSGQMRAVNVTPSELSPQLRVSDSGRLTFGHGPDDDGPFEFKSVGLDGVMIELQVPVAYGFPLAR